MLRISGLVALWATGSLALAAPGTPYAGQDARPIKALSAEDIADLEAGRGMGLAKSAELNGYPGPLHVIELSGELHLSAEQLRASQAIFDAMKAGAIAVGRQVIEAERELEALFRSRDVPQPALAAAVSRIGELQARLRGIHLQAHVAQSALLEPAQLARYAQLRGYDSGSHVHPGAAETPPPHD